MTTVAYNHKDKQVAVDSRYSRAEIISTDKGDKTRKNDRGLWIFAGQPCDYADLMKLNKGDKVDIRPQCGAFLISNGKCYCIDTDEEGYYSEELLDDDFTMGSGQWFALSALDLGKSAKESVTYAKTRDMHTGGRVRVFDVK